jgi:protein-disulfide isomerase
MKGFLAIAACMLLALAVRRFSPPLCIWLQFKLSYAKISPSLISSSLHVLVFFYALLLRLLYVLHETYAQVVSAQQLPIPKRAPGVHLGNPSAPIHITEFADYQCPYCASACRPSSLTTHCCCCCTCWA